MKDGVDGRKMGRGVISVEIEAWGGRGGGTFSEDVHVIWIAVWFSVNGRSIFGCPPIISLFLRSHGSHVE